MSKIRERYEKAVKNYACTHIAFWRYDSFPFVISSPVNKVSFDEDCTISAYSPLFQGRIIPKYIDQDFDESIDKVEKLSQLERDYVAAKNKLLDEYVQKAKMIVPELASIIGH